MYLFKGPNIISSFDAEDYIGITVFRESEDGYTTSKTS